MIDKLKELELNKILNELSYIESDYEYKSELINKIDYDFIESIDIFLNKHIELKEIYEDKISIKIEEVIQKNSSELKIEKSPTKIFIDKDVKRLYREIVKITHPDILVDKKYNNLYIKATEFYNLNDKISIYKICRELDINFNVSNDDIISIENKITDIKNKINFLESTFTWKWNNNDDINKEKIIFEYIKTKII